MNFRYCIVADAAADRNPAGFDRSVVGWIRIDNREQLAGELDIADPSALPETELVSAAFDRWGEECVDHLEGDFSFAVFDETKGSVFAARDPFGVRPCYIHRNGSAVSIASSVAEFRALGLTLTPSEEWIARYLIRNSMSHEATAYHEVTKLPGGHRMTFDLDDPGGSLHVERWHHFVDDAPTEFERDEQRVASYRDVLVEAVRVRIVTDRNLGVETSGGIDSSTCLGFAADLWERPLDEIHGFGYVGFEDEPDFILETSRQHRVENNVIIGPGDPRRQAASLDHTLDVLGHPEERGNGPGFEPFLREAEQRGVDVLLSGFGGDEGVTNPALLLDRELLDHRRYLVLCKEMFGPWWERPLRLVQRVRRHRKGSKMTPVVSTMISRRWDHFALRPEVAERYGMRNDFLAGASWDQGYRTVNEFVLGNRILRSSVPTRLENCSLMAAAHGIEYRWPLLDPRLVQQYLSTPSIEKKHKNMGRYLHRRAIEGLVPPKVQWKQDKHMGDKLTERNLSAPPDNLEVLDDLHPLLATVVDAGRLRALIEDGERGDAEFAMVANEQFRHVEILDHWLRRFHPDARAH